MNPQKSQPVVYTMSKDNGTSASFMQLMYGLIAFGWLLHGDIVCLDNARIHMSGEARNLGDLRWNYSKDSQPLHNSISIPTNPLTRIEPY